MKYHDDAKETDTAGDLCSFHGFPDARPFEDWASGTGNEFVAMGGDQGSGVRDAVWALLTHTLPFVLSPPPSL
jgi:hypothetical protein